MRKRITYIVEPRFDYVVENCYFVHHGKKLLSANSAWITNSRERMKGMGLELPPGKYKVTYTLHPEGEFYSRSCAATPFMYRVDKIGENLFNNQIINCLIPVEWEGLKFNRKVVAL